MDSSKYGFTLQPERHLDSPAGGDAGSAMQPDEVGVRKPLGASASRTADTGRWSPALALFFAVACALSVASLYCAQPLLDAMARDFAIPPAAIGTVVTATQLGYALGLVLIVPLGDLLDRRRLVVGQTGLAAIALGVVGLAPTRGVLLSAVAAVGLLSVVIQVLVAFAASLAAPTERGRAVGTVTSGIVIGILLARFVAGAVADIGGWRCVYLGAASLMLIMTGLLSRVLPRDTRQAPPATGIGPGGYLRLVGSVGVLLREEPVLRIRGVLSLLIFAAFNVLWTPLILPLSAPPLSLSRTAIGAFGLVGLAGALAAARTGEIADRGHGQHTTGLALLLMLIAWLPIGLLHSSLATLAGGVLLLDLAIQAVHVTNQSLIFAVRPEARSRLVCGYMVFYSLGSASGAIASTAVYAIAGWLGVCLLGAVISLAAVAFWSLTLRAAATGRPSVLLDPS